MNTKKNLIRIATLLLLFISTATFAQTGRLVGKVTDAKTGETLIGVPVVVQGTTTAVPTNIEGRYEMRLSPGVYTIDYKYIGYQTKSISGVVINLNAITELNVILEEESLTLGEVVIVSTFKQESVNALYSIQKNNISISSGISADIIRRSPDKNIGEALKRVSGTSIQENKFVIVRGLADRYNTATINNASLPSSEPDRKAFSFDLIPSNMIDNILINKTSTPDLPGDFAGGIVQVFTKDIPDENFVNFSIGFGYNTESTFKDFVSNERGKTDFIGFDNGRRSLPNGFPGSRQQYVVQPLSQRIQQSQLFANSYGEQTVSALPTQSYQLTFGNQKGLKSGGSYGSIFSLTYRNSLSSQFVDRNDFQFDGSFNKDFDDIQYKYSTNLGLLANFALIKGNTKIAFKNLLNRVFEENYNDRTGIDNSFIQEIRVNSSELTQKTLVNSQLEGDHRFENNSMRFVWNANYNLTLRDQPDLRTIFYGRAQNSTDAFSIVDRNSRRFFSDLSENTFGANATLAVPFTFLKERSTFKFGGSAQLKVRDFSARIFNYQAADFQNFDNNLSTLPKDRIFDPNNIRQDGFVLNDFTNNSDAYNAESRLFSGFAMLDNKLGKKSRLVWGVRVESYYQFLDAVDASNSKVLDETTYLDVLPSLNYTYNVTERSNLRLSGSITVSRPEFRELAPFDYFDFITNTAVSGNPNLQRSQNYNADARYEFYPSAGEAITFSVFYKKFNDPIEQIIDPRSNADLRAYTYGNAESATALGLELEFRKKLNFISTAEWLENLIFYSNLSYIDSKVDVVGTERTLQGQSPYLVNAGFQYSNSNNTLSFNLLYNRIGERISTVGNISFNDVFEAARDVIDFQISTKIIKGAGELKLTVSDILAQEVTFYENANEKLSYQRGVDKIIQSSKLGSTISLGFSYNFKNKNSR